MGARAARMCAVWVRTASVFVVVVHACVVGVRGSQLRIIDGHSVCLPACLPDSSSPVIACECGSLCVGVIVRVHLFWMDLCGQIMSVPSWIVGCKWDVRDSGAEANAYVKQVGDVMERLGALLDDLVRCMTMCVCLLVCVHDFVFVFVCVHCFVAVHDFVCMTMCA